MSIQFHSNCNNIPLHSTPASNADNLVPSLEAHAALVDGRGALGKVGGVSRVVGGGAAPGARVNHVPVG